VVVALDDGGGVVRGRLVGTSRHPRNVATVRRVRLTTFVAGTDQRGTEAIAYAFEPEPVDDIPVDEISRDEIPGGRGE
jgi:hypothetical protein